MRSASSNSGDASTTTCGGTRTSAVAPPPSLRSRSKTTPFHPTHSQPRWTRFGGGRQIDREEAASGILRRIFGERLTVDQKDFPMSFRASMFAAATVFASMTATVAATASIARAQAPAPRFKVLVIGGINYKNYVSRFASGTVRVEDSAHPVLKDVPANFPISTEEWYIWDRSPRARVHVLASVDESTYEFVDASESGIRMGDHPVIWTNDKLRARNLYIFMGHHPNLFANAAYTTFLTNAIMSLAHHPHTIFFNHEAYTL